MTTMPSLASLASFARTPSRADALPFPGGAAGAPRVLLRLEGALVLVLATLAYAHLGLAGWGLFAACFLAPDLAFLGYLAGPRLGAIAYNTTHSTLGYAGLAALGVVLGAPTLLALALIGVAHVGFDRMLGYGLKYGSAFGHTHLGVVGRDR